MKSYEQQKLSFFKQFGAGINFIIILKDLQCLNFKKLKYILKFPIKNIHE